MSVWDGFMTEQDRSTLVRGKWAHRVGFGERPAVLVVDAQYFMFGERGCNDSEYPLSCGEVGWAAVDAAKPLLAAARLAGAPIIYSCFVLDPAGTDGGIYARKIQSGKGEYAWLRGTKGAELIEDVGARPGDFIFEKTRQSAFFGTPLLGYLIDQRIDTLIVIGGSTSNCIRASAVDGSMYNFRVIIPEEAVFDRIALSHAAALFDINRTYGDVLPVNEVQSYLAGLRSGGT